jgi:hypothetical protein
VKNSAKITAKASPKSQKALSGGTFSFRPPQPKAQMPTPIRVPKIERALRDRQG